MKILVIDDNAILINGINSRFCHQGEIRVAAECCESFEDAIMAIGRHHPTIILLDDDLGKPRDGLEVARGLQELNPKYEVISTTGTTNQDILDEYRELGIPLLKKEQVSMIQWIRERLDQEPK